VTDRLLGTVEPGSILEIGCGQGAFGARLARRATYLALEPDERSFLIAKPRIESAGGRVANLSSDRLGNDNQFDLVCAFEVLEHFEDDSAAIEEWREHVAPGGHLMISMPAWQQRFNSWDRMVGHYRRYSPACVTELLHKSGFVDVRVVVYGWPLGYALEWVRSGIARRRGVATETDSPSMQMRTAASGRVLQPKAIRGWIMQVGVAPFVAMQSLAPGHGTGLVAVARRP
jgi:SAM-dependent methyltransferase